MKTLNSNEAFAAMMSGKNIMCRAIGDLIEFNDLNQFPATIFAMPNYEFCIKRETLTLADIQFTKPVETHDLDVGQEIYIVMPTCILRTQYDSEHGDICLSVANGFVQLDEENAKLQLQAFGKTFGNMITDIQVKDGFNDKPKKMRSSRIKKNESNLVETESVKPIGTENLNAQWEEPETDPIKLVANFTTQIQKFTKCDDVLNFRHVFLANGHLDQEHQQHLCKISEDKLLELDPQQYLPKVQQHEPDLTNFGESIEYQTLLNDLINRAQEANTPTEATKLTGYTKSWTENQRKPLINAIHKRLNELNIAAEPPAQPPSLMVRIQNSLNEHELNELLPEIRSRHPDIQPKLMDCVRARRFELENTNTKAVPL